MSNNTASLKHPKVIEEVMKQGLDWVTFVAISFNGRVRLKTERNNLLAKKPVKYKFFLVFWGNDCSEQSVERRVLFVLCKSKELNLNQRQDSSGFALCIQIVIQFVILTLCNCPVEYINTLTLMGFLHRITEKNKLCYLLFAVCVSEVAANIIYVDKLLLKPFRH